MPGSPTFEADVAVIGAGGAGLFVAHSAAALNARVALISATSLAQTASYWAQGGLAAALADDDSPERHLDDTERAGRGLVRSAAARALSEEAPARVHELEELGVHFDADPHGRIELALEGGHSRRRVAHAGGSATGRRVVRQLSAVVAADPAITVIENARACALLRSEAACAGVVCEDGRTITARAVVICSGGGAALWARTTNPPGSQGAGLLLARSVGAQLADLEFVQFHPTAVIGVPGREGFLVTEAIRGEGATLLDRDGERFVDELAPRDEVACAIQDRLDATGERAVALDMRGVDPARFPNVVSALAEAGLDVTKQTVPVAPAAHYVMGGIVTDMDGRATVPGLLAVGESACTGLHGANRLASNSLTECFVFGARAARAALDQTPTSGAGTPEPAQAATLEATPATRAALWERAGLRRDGGALEQLLEDEHPLARLVAAGALAREESRGAHRRIDWPEPDPALDHMHSILDAATDTPRMERWA